MYINASGNLNVPKIVVHALIAVIALVLLFGSWVVIGPQERGVKVRLGVVQGMLTSGFHFKLPLLDSVTKMDVRTQTLTATKDSPLTAASNDLQDTRLAVVVNYHINPTDVVDIYQQYGDAETYYNSIVSPLIVSTLKAVASQYTAADQIQKRQEMSDKALSALTAAFADKNVTIEKADITDIAFSDSFTQAIEAKVTAVQDAEAAQNKLVQIQAEAQQTIATAQATAEAQRISSAALAAQGGSDYVALQAIQKWDGHYPSTYLGSASSLPIINLGSK